MKEVIGETDCESIKLLFGTLIMTGDRLCTTWSRENKWVVWLDSEEPPFKVEFHHGHTLAEALCKLDKWIEGGKSLQESS